MSSLPLVALVGRPNVGKSTLFNRFAGRRLALVQNLPGVTRDRIFAECTWEDRAFRVVDTGGLVIGEDDPLTLQVRRQSEVAVEEADLVLLVLDAREGRTPMDEEVADLLRRSGKPTLLVANKVDGPNQQDMIAELYGLGFDDLYSVSAEHGVGYGELADAVIARLGAPAVDEADPAAAALPVSDEEPPEGQKSQIEWDGGPIRVAVVGRPNAGKSSLINAMLGEDRFLASEIAGTTRDSADAELDIEGQPFVFVDTAGIRRKKSITAKLEQAAVIAAVKSMDRADVVFLVLDATTGLSDQDARIAALAKDRGKGLVLVANKWDALDLERKEAFIAGLERALRFVEYAPMARVSAKNKRGLQRLAPMAVACQEERHRRVATSELNKFFREVVENQPPPTRKGKRPRLFYVTQPLIRPPTFIVSASRVEIIRTSYRNFLQNTLRKRYGFEGTPIWVKFRQR